MKAIKLIIVTGSIFLASIPTAFADVQECPPDAVHCAYVSGLSDQVNDGRYIKLENKTLGKLVICFNQFSTAFLDQFSAAKYLGANNDTYSICADSQGKQCEQIGVDHFVISKVKGGFNADPKLYNIDLSAYQDKYPTCNAASYPKFKK